MQGERWGIARWRKGIALLKVGGGVGTGFGAGQLGFGAVEGRGMRWGVGTWVRGWARDSSAGFG
jgi:hypothetical protein